MTPAQFYAADPRRRHSPEVLFGPEWHDGNRGPYSLHWLEATGELVLIGRPGAAEAHATAAERPVGLAAHGVLRFAARLRRGDSAGAEVLGRFGSITEVGQVLAGWEEAARRPDGVRWLRDQVARSGGPRA